MTAGRQAVAFCERLNTNSHRGIDRQTEDETDRQKKRQTRTEGDELH